MTDFQPFSSKKFVKKINLRVPFLPLKIAFFVFLKMIKIFNLNLTWLQKVIKLDFLQNLNFFYLI